MGVDFRGKAICTSAFVSTMHCVQISVSVWAILYWAIVGLWKTAGHCDVCVCVR